MVKRKERNLKELYNVSQLIAKAEITPVLRGNCRMQGPIEEADYAIRANTVSAQEEKGLVCLKSGKFHKSGTCNVCSTPCSSCLHINRVLMGSKTEEFYDETCRGSACSQYSVNDVVPPPKSSGFDSGRHTASEASSFLSVNSSHDSFSENAESKASLRISDVSNASEDVEMSSQLSSGGAVVGDQLLSKLQCSSDKTNRTNKFGDPKGLEGHNDNILFVSGANVPNKLATYNNVNLEREYVPHCSASTISLVPEGCVKTVQTDIGCSKMNYDVPPGDKILSCDPKEKNLEESQCFHFQGDLPECSKDPLNSLLTKDEASDIGYENKSSSCKCCDTQNSRVSLTVQNSEPSEVVSLNLESETGNAQSELPADALNSSEQMEEDEKIEYLVSSDGQETSLQSCPLDESDESDIVEQDVKVCDICGDAGREDLLAVCSCCSDGAEHTYCMRDTLDKVPEGDWLCEECKFEERIENQKLDKYVTVDGNERNQSSGQANAVDADLFKKLDTKNSDVEKKKTVKDMSSAKASGKRHSENIEVALAAKRQALEPIVVSPKTSSPSRIASLSRDRSFKDLDRGIVKLVHQPASGPPSAIATPETACSPTTGPRLQTARGTFLKSNSFSSSNAKPKVQLVDEVVPQKQKSAREHASLDMRKGDSRLMGKSMSFRSGNSGRPYGSESKVKMLSPKFSHGQDLKGLNKSKHWNSVERKNSFRAERPLVNAATASTTRLDNKLASHACGSNSHESKALESDSTLTASSKSTSNVARIDSQMPAALGEIKTQASCLPNIGASSLNGSSSSLEQKQNQISPKDDRSLSISCEAERPFCSVPPDELACPQEPVNLGGRIRENSLSQSRTRSNGERSVPCQKCKEIGHSAQFCTVDSPRPHAVGTSSLKAAIEAALLKKPGLGRKNRDPCRSDDLSMSIQEFNCQKASQDKLSIPFNMITADEIHEGQALPQDSTAYSCKQTTINNLKQFSAVITEAVNSETRDASDGKACTVNVPRQVSTAISSVPKTSAIPELQYIWQGGFEVHKSGELPELHFGIQAHLSTCASPRVLEAVNKFSRKVLLKEVPRLRTWPLQFQERGVKEDNIGLYFFAKDIESYEKSYKSLLESMMKGDLALKGTINGVELLIFPSNKLPENSQRWNTMFFLWGVFREKRVICSQHVPDSPERSFIPRCVPSAIMSLPNNICSLGPIDKNLSAHKKPLDVALSSRAPASRELPGSSSETNGDSVIVLSSLDLPGQCGQASVRQKDDRPDSASFRTIQPISELSSPRMNFTSNSLEKHVTDCELNTKYQLSLQNPRTYRGSNERQAMVMHGDAPLDRPQTLSGSFKELAVGAQEVGALGSAGTEKIVPDRENSTIDQVKYEKDEEGSVDTQTDLERVMRGQTLKELNCRHFNDSGCLQIDPTESVYQPSDSTSQTIPLHDVNSLLVAEGASKKQKTGLSGLYDYNSRTENCSSVEGFGPEACGVGTSLQIEEEILDETVIPQDSGNAERYFFPVDPPPVKDFGLGDCPMPCKVFPSKEGDWVCDVGPNLELALGGEMIPSKQGTQSFLTRKVDDKDQAQPRDILATKVEEDNVSASLSLSLSFSLPDNASSCTLCTL